MASKKVAASKKASGRNVRESERGTVAVKLRLEPDTAEDLKLFAEDSEQTVSKIVDAAMTLIYRLNEGDLSDLTGQEIYEVFVRDIGTQHGRDLDTLAVCAEIIAKNPR